MGLRLNTQITTLKSLSAAYAQLGNLAELDQDWDSYGASPPTSVALSRASRLMLDVATQALESSDIGEAISKPWFIAPLADGGIQIEWRNGTRAVEVEIGPEGRLQYLVENEDSLIEVSNGVTGADWPNVVAAVCQVLS